MVATQESINSRSCSVLEIKLSVFLKGGHLTRSGSTSTPPKVREKTITKTKNTHSHIPRSLTFLLNQFNIPLGSLQHYKSQIFLNIRTTIETPKNGGTVMTGRRHQNP